jgi:hypothetical protein
VVVLLRLSEVLCRLPILLKNNNNNKKNRLVSFFGLQKRTGCVPHTESTGQKPTRRAASEENHADGRGTSWTAALCGKSSYLFDDPNNYPG